MDLTHLRFRVLEAYTRDSGTDIARIDYDSMDMLGCSHGLDKSMIIISNTTLDTLTVERLRLSDDGKDEYDRQQPEPEHPHQCIICEQYLTDHTEEDLRDCIANLEEKIKPLKNHNRIYNYSKCICGDIIADHKTEEQKDSEIAIYENKRRWWHKKKSPLIMVFEFCIENIEVEKEEMQTLLEKLSNQYRKDEGMLDDAKDELNTVAECNQLYPSDEGKYPRIIRINETIRNSIGVEIGDDVWVTR